MDTTTGGENLYTDEDMQQKKDLLNNWSTQDSQEAEYKYEEMEGGCTQGSGTNVRISRPNSKVGIPTQGSNYSDGSCNNVDDYSASPRH